MVALERANIPVDKYYASEIDKYAIKISQKNYPDVIQLGDIRDITEETLDKISPIDLIIGGSPCQDLSNYKYDRGEVTGLNGTKSSLFYEYIRILKYVKPKYFLLENVASMEDKWKDIISDLLGVKPIMINSSLVCAAERKRLYWTNIPNVTEPKDKGIVLKDICLPAYKVPDKYWYKNKYPITVHDGDVKVKATIHLNSHERIKEVYGLNHKCNTLLRDGDGENRVKKIYQNNQVRKLTPIEYERLQTLPDNYTNCVSDSRRYSAIGNGWTVDVIKHILSGLKENFKTTKYLYLIVGESGTGKDTVVNSLNRYGGLTRVKSYTTRPSRSTEEDKLSHIFVDVMTKDDFSNAVAYTHYNEYDYWVTQSQLDKSDLYIIDPSGIDYFKEHYKGERPFKIINLYVDEQERINRMKSRGDNDENIKQRVFYDKSAFKNISADVKIENRTLQDCIKNILNYILSQEKGI